MTRVLLLGLAPLPFENQQKMYGPGIRTWQFAKPLAEDGHQVCVIASRIPFAYPDDEPPIRRSTRDGVTIYTVAQSIFETTNFVQTIHDDFRPDCVVGATIFPSYVAARLKTECPLWADLFGHAMAEAQAKAHVYGSDEYLCFFWNWERLLLMRGDMFSVVSQPQKFATIGELGAFGRLNRHTFQYDLIRSIPCAIEGDPPKHSRTVFRGVDVAQDDFVVLWSGGYNTWTDVDSLMAGLEQAMDVNPHIKFVSTGGQIDGHDEFTYPRFVRLIEQSRHANNFILRGWIPTEEVPNYYYEADVGINIDSDNYEAVLGSRNRILSWLAAGLPVVTTNSTEIAQVVHDHGLGHVFPHRDPVALADQLVRMSNHRDELRTMGQRGREYVLAHYTYRTTAAPLRQWIANPQPAPDRGLRVPLEVRQQPNLIALVSREICQYYRSRGLRAVVNRVGGFGLRVLGQRVNPPAQPIRYLVRFHELTVPEQMNPGQTYPVHITVVNQSSRTWSNSRSPAARAVHLSYRWHEDKQRRMVCDGPRFSLPTAVRPGQAVTLPIKVRAPEASGRYVLTLDMIENATWFSEIVPGIAQSIPVVVGR